MTPMPNPAHAKPARQDHLWVLAVIAAFALFDVWGAWAQVGDKSGFAVGHTGTGWTLTVIVEAAAGYFLFAWFSAPGRRSRRFAMCSAFAALALSLIGQGASSFAAKAQPPPWLAVFVKDLPVVVLALIAVLIHMRRLDREESAEAVRQDAKDAEIASLRAALGTAQEAPRAELEALRAELEAAVSARESAQAELAEALTRAESLAKKLAAKSAQASAQKSRKAKRESAQAEDLTIEFRALDEFEKDPGLRKPRMGGELARRLGVSPATGRRLHSRLTAQDRPAESLTERSPGLPDERSGERS
jgi:hypothetical protein